MKILLGTLFLALVVFINFGELKAVRPHTRQFEYLGEEVLVWDDENGRPIHMRLAGGNRNILPEWHRNYHVETFLQFKSDLFFLVTTVKYRNWKIIAKIENEPAYNAAGYSGFTQKPHSSMDFAGRTVDIYRNGEGHATRVRFSDRNVIPPQGDLVRYQIKPDTISFSDFRMTYYSLKFGYVIGVELARNNG